LEGRAFAGGGLPAGGSDLDKLAIGIGEVEEDVAGTFGSDAAVDVVAHARLAPVSLGFQVIEKGVEVAGGGQGIVLDEEFVEEPVAKGARADGEDVEASGRRVGEANECLAVSGGEWQAALDDGEVGS
jgi:hypothetical protein